MLGAPYAFTSALPVLPIPFGVTEFVWPIRPEAVAPGTGVIPMLGLVVRPLFPIAPGDNVGLPAAAAPDGDANRGFVTPVPEGAAPIVEVPGTPGFVLTPLVSGTAELTPLPSAPGADVVPPTLPAVPEPLLPAAAPIAAAGTMHPMTTISCLANFIIGRILIGVLRADNCGIASGKRLDRETKPAHHVKLAQCGVICS